MSDNRSPSPTSNSQLSFDTQTEHLPQASSSTSGGRLSSFVPQFCIENPAGTSYQKNSQDERPRKRMRRLDSEERGKRYTGRSTPSDSSQSDREEHGSDGGDHNQPSASPTTYEFAEPKKKRTRTLTTPHQAAVLHALLAQSRFPTTAMREEVGKQIGLSARKVQIWFQNQRQKARRPPPQTAPSTNRAPPVYGPFGPPGAPPSTSPSVEFYGAPHDPSGSHTTNSRQAEHPWASGQRRRGLDGRFLPPEDAPQSLTPGFWLSGPGMPGATTQAAQPGPSSSSGQLTHHSCCSEQTSPSTRHAMVTMPRRHSQSPPRMRPSAARTSSMRMSSDDMRDRTFSRTLPPLIFDASRPRVPASPSSPANYQFPLSTRSAPSAIPSFDARPQSSPSESPFAHDVPEPRTPRDIPAPFALQPMPQWDNASYGSHSRPSTSSWSRPSTSYSASGESSHPIRSHERVVSDLVARQQVREAIATPRPSPISRRFDPVYDSVSANEANRHSSSPPSSAGNIDARDEEMA